MPAIAYIAAWIAFYCASIWALGAVHGCSDLPAPNGLTYVALSRGPALDVPAIQSCHASAAPLFTVLALGYATLTALWFRLLGWRPKSQNALAWITLPVAPFVAIVLIGFPFVSTSDAYAYALYAYEAGILHLSPYTSHALPLTQIGVTLTQLFPDPHSDIRIMNYGPVFGFAYALVGIVVNALGGVSLDRFIMGERVFSALCVVATAVLISRSRAVIGRSEALVLVLTSPLLLIEGVCFAHGDVFMLALLCAALLFWERERWFEAGIFIGLAFGVRSVALLALLAASMYAYRSNPKRLVPLWGGAVLSVAVAAACSMQVFGDVSFGGGAAIDPFGSPVAIAVNLIGGVNFSHTVLATGVQAAIGLTLVAFALLSNAYDYVPFGALAAAPALRPWYCQWLVPMLALRTSQLTKRLAYTVVSLAILSEGPLLVGDSKTLAIAVVAVQWAVPLGILVLSRKQSLRD